MVGRNKAIEGLVHGLLGQLQVKNNLIQNIANSFLIDKRYLAHIFEYLISMLSTRDLLACNRLFHNFPELRDILESISSYCKDSAAKQRD
jgi:hypothetical protein